MSDRNKHLTGTPGKIAVQLFLGCVISGNAAAVIDGTGSKVIDGTGARVIDGTGARVIDGTGARVIDGTGSYVIDGTGSRVIDGTGARVIDGTGSYVIDGTGSRVIDGTGARVIDGTGSYVIDGTGSRVIDGTGSYVIDGTGTRHIVPGYLLARGQIDYIGEGFLSVMGQTVIDDGGGFGGLAAGATIAVYGAIDADSGGFVDAQIVQMAPSGVDAGVADFLRGLVDSVDVSVGIAVIGGLTVDYSATLANGVAPRVGDEFSITGRNYRDLGLLVADP